MARRRRSGRSLLSKRGLKNRLIPMILILLGVLVVFLLYSRGAINIKNKADTIGCTYSQPAFNTLEFGDLPYTAPYQTEHLALRIVSGVVGGSGCPTHRFKVEWSSGLPGGITASISPSTLEIPSYPPDSGPIYQGEGYGSRLVDIAVTGSSYGTFELPLLKVTDLDQSDPNLASRTAMYHSTVHVGGPNDVYTMNISMNKPSYTLGSKVTAQLSMFHLGSSFTMPEENAFGAGLMHFISWWVRKPDGTFYDIPPSTFHNNPYKGTFTIGKKDPKGIWQLYIYACCNEFSNIISQNYASTWTTFEVK